MRLARALLREPWIVFAPLVLVQWGAVLAFALTVRHNGWLYYQGGDQTFYYTTAWALSDGHIPKTSVGYGWSYLLSPVPLVNGPNMLSALPALVLLNVLVLGPIALACVCGIATRIGGRLVGYFAASLWVAVPFLAIPLFVHRYHEKYVEQFLPQALGFTGLADYPSMVCLLVAAYFGFRTLDSRGAWDAWLAGLFAAFAAGIKPANLVFLAAPALALLLARAWRSLLPFAGGLLPPLLALLVWKQRGLGEAPVALAGLGHAGAALLATLGPLDKYTDFSWAQLKINYLSLREVFWSTRMLEWGSLAGLVAVALRSVPKAAFLGVWFAAFLVVKGGSERATVDSGSFFRLVMPGFPALLLVAAALPLLAPSAGRWLAARWPERESASNSLLPARPRGPIAAAVFLGLLPLVLVAALPTFSGTQAVNEFNTGVFVPVDEDFAVRGDPAADGSIRLVWDAPVTGSTDAFYRVFRSPAVLLAPDPDQPPGREGIRCLPTSITGGGAPQCSIEMDVIGTTRDTQFDTQLDPVGRWTYRVALASNWLDDPALGDIVLLSAPLDVSRPQG